MRALYPLLALALLAASPPCGTAAASSAGDYGLGPGPSPAEVVTSDGKVLTVRQALGDRMFTQVVSRYDAATITLLSAERSASCCLTYWHSTVTRNPDGSYDLESQSTMPSSHGNDVYKESRPHLEVQGGAPIAVAGLFFIPWMHHVTHTSAVMQIDFDPLRVEYLTISDTSPAPYPTGVPAHDRALRVMVGDQATTL